MKKEYLAKKWNLQSTKTPARVLLELSGSWDDNRNSEEIVREIKSVRPDTRHQ